MTWARTAGRTAARAGVKYGPHAVAVWKIAGHHVEVAARHKLDEVAARRTAFDHAGVTAHGSVLRLVERGQAVFVVFSGDEPVASDPSVERPLTQLTATADLSQRSTPDEHQERRLRARVRRAGTRVKRRGLPFSL